MGPSGSAALGIAMISSAVLVSACAANNPPRTRPTAVIQETSSTVVLHGNPLELHLSVPRQPSRDGVLVLYASGDGGWFGAAVNMFQVIGHAGYYTVGFSARSFLKLERPRGTDLNLKQLADEYEQILLQARTAMHLDPATPAILTGWSRGAAFAVLAASEPAVRRDIRGVIAIGLTEGEDLQAGGADDETDDGAAGGERHWPFEPYARIARLGRLPCAVIQSRGDHYLPAARARELFGADTSERRFYAIDARNHRFSGGTAAFDNALLDAIAWMSATR